VSKPTVTIVIPHLPEREELLAELLKSIELQTYQPDEVIIEIAQPEDNAAVTRTRACEKVKTTRIALVDDDDLLLPNHLDVLMRRMDEWDFDLTYSYFRSEPKGIDPLGRFGAVFSGFHLIQANYIPITHLIRTELLQSCLPYEPMPDDVRALYKNKLLEDWHMLLKLLDIDCRFNHVPVVSWVWRQHDGQTNGQCSQSVLSNSA
jgi:hypothetical protein